MAIADAIGALTPAECSPATRRRLTETLERGGIPTFRTADRAMRQLVRGCRRRLDTP